MSPERIAQLGALAAQIERWRAKADADAVLGWLERVHGARLRFVNGADELLVAGVTASCSNGPAALLDAWLRVVRGMLARAEFTQSLTERKHDAVV